MANTTTTTTTEDQDRLKETAQQSETNLGAKQGEQVVDKGADAQVTGQTEQTQQDRQDQARREALHNAQGEQDLIQ